MLLSTTRRTLRVLVCLICDRTGDVTFFFICGVFSSGRGWKGADSETPGGKPVLIQNSVPASLLYNIISTFFVCEIRGHTMGVVGC